MVLKKFMRLPTAGGAAAALVSNVHQVLRDTRDRAHNRHAVNAGLAFALGLCEGTPDAPAPGVAGLVKEIVASAQIKAGRLFPGFHSKGGRARGLIMPGGNGPGK